MNKIQLAKNPNTPVETLHSLATDEDSGVRWYVVQNPNTSPETLQTLATDENSAVRWYVGRHSNATELIRRLVLMTNSKQKC